jgi:tRNA (guanine37-N1)-methyltransferase
VDGISRFIPQVIGNVESVKSDSFFEGLLEFPQYTRPRNFRGMEVPEILFSGDHSKIKSWRRKKSLKKTWLQRRDLLENRKLSAEEKKILEEITTEKRGKKDESD